MTEFTIKLAGIAVGVTALYQETELFCKGYLTEEDPVFNVSVNRDDILSERIRNERQMMLEGFLQADFTDEYMETLALYRKVTAELLCHNIILFHSAVVALNGKAYAFTAKSGTGKTTHVNLWKKHIPGCYILNGDKPLLLFRDGKVYACGTPWMGKEACGTNEILPLDAVCILKRAAVNHIEEITIKGCFDVLLNQCHVPDGSGSIFKVLGLLRELSKRKLYCLRCNMEDEAALVSYRGMVNE